MNKDQASRWAEEVLSDKEIAALACTHSLATEVTNAGYKDDTLWFDGDCTEFVREAIAAALVKLTQGQEAVAYVDPSDLDDLLADRLSGITCGVFSERQRRTLPLYTHPAPSQQEDRKPESSADELLGAKIRKLCDGGTFDLTDSPHSMCNTVIRLCKETAAHNIKEQK